MSETKVPTFDDVVIKKLQKIINHAGGIILQNDVEFSAIEQLKNRDGTPRNIWQAVTKERHANMGVFAPFMHTYSYQVSIYLVQKDESDPDQKEMRLIAEYSINYEHHTMGSNGVCATQVAEIKLRISENYIGTEWHVREQHGDESGAIARSRYGE